MKVFAENDENLERKSIVVKVFASYQIDKKGFHEKFKICSTHYVNLAIKSIYEKGCHKIKRIPFCLLLLFRKYWGETKNVTS